MHLLRRVTTVPCQLLPLIGLREALPAEYTAIRCVRGGAAQLSYLLHHYTFEIADDFEVVFEGFLIHAPNLVLLLLYISHFLVQFLLESLHLVEVFRGHALVFLQLVTKLLHFIVLGLDLHQYSLGEQLCLRLMLALEVGVHQQMVHHGLGWRGGTRRSRLLVGNAMRPTIHLIRVLDYTCHFVT